MFWPGNVEKPPDQYMNGNPAAKVEEYRTNDEIHKRCTSLLGDLANPYARFLGCYDPQSNVIVVPTQDGSWVAKALMIHERAHEYGWRHPSKDW